MLSIIIITYNSHTCIKDCLDSIWNSQFDEPFNVVLIDNDSKDKSKTKSIVEGFGKDNIFFLDNQENLGFAKAVNQAIKHCQKHFQSQYYLLFNPDATLEKTCLKQMLLAFKDDASVGLVSAKIIDPRNSSIWFSQAHIDWRRLKSQHSLNKIRFEDTKFFSNVPYLTGCCLMIKSSVVDKIGYLDERFFLYYEDADFSLRAQKAGFKIRTANEAICYHTESQSSTSKTKNYFLAKSGLLFFEKHLRSFWRIYFWLNYYLRFFYHKFFSHKSEVLQGLIDFKKQLKR